jgi:hypothetical protein
MYLNAKYVEITFTAVMMSVTSTPAVVVTTSDWPLSKYGPSSWGP